MKLVKVALLLLAGVQAAVEESESRAPVVDPNDDRLSQSFATAFSLEPPRIMNDSVAVNDLPQEAGTHLTAAETGNAFQDGWYYNTTRIEEKQSYLYMWRHACAFTKWVPSNQFLHANRLFDAGSMTLERFGLIGMDQRCYWGCIGVLWKRPLPLWEILPNQPPVHNQTRTPAPPAEPPREPIEVEGLQELHCYRLQAYEHTADYIKVMNGNEVYNSPTEGSETIWRMREPLTPSENSFSLESYEMNGKYLYIENDLAFADSPNGGDFNDRATFKIVPGKIGGRGVAFQAINTGDEERYLIHEPYVVDVPSHRVLLETWSGAFAQRKAVSYNFEEISCTAHLAETHENDFFPSEYQDTTGPHQPTDNE